MLVGGYAGTWIDGADARRSRSTTAGLPPTAPRPGPGVIALLGAGSCGVAETVRVARWLATESAGQCGPCVHGLGRARCAPGRVGVGRRAGPCARRCARLGAVIRGRGACRHPDGTLRFISSALDLFAAEFADHARHGPCDACSRPPALPLPRSGRARPSRRRTRAMSAHRHVRVNPIACEAHGMCAELLPEMVALDEWGYPIVDGRALPDDLLAHAERAAEACPTFALLVERGRAPARDSQRPPGGRCPPGATRRCGAQRQAPRAPHARLSALSRPRAAARCARRRRTRARSCAE